MLGPGFFGVLQLNSQEEFEKHKQCSSVRKQRQGTGLGACVCVFVFGCVCLSVWLCCMGAQVLSQCWKVIVLK